MNELKNGYRTSILRGVSELESNKKNHTAQQFFDIWFDNYSGKRLEEFQKYKSLSAPEFECFYILDDTMKTKYENFLKTSVFTQEMWDEILEKLRLFRKFSTIDKSLLDMHEKDKLRKDDYRNFTIERIKESFLPEKNWGEDEFFYTWLDDTYRGNFVELMRKIESFSKEEFKILDALDAVVKDEYKNWMRTKKFTDAMLERINGKRREFLDQVENV